MAAAVYVNPADVALAACRIPGGTNDFSNLVLIQKDPYHIAVTNKQRELTAGLLPGETRTVKYPIIEGFVYPP